MSEYLWGVFVKKRSRREDFSGHLRFKRVGSVISWVRFKESQVDLKPSETDGNQSQFKSPLRRISLKLKVESWLLSDSKASLFAEGGLEQHTTVIKGSLRSSNLRTRNSNCLLQDADNKVAALNFCFVYVAIPPPFLGRSQRETL